MKWILPFLIGFLYGITNVFAFDGVTLELGSIIGNGWQAEQVSIKLNWLKNTNQSALRLDVATLNLPKLKTSLQALSLNCHRAEYKPEKITCFHASLAIGGNFIERPITNLAFTYHFNSQRIDFNLDKFALASGIFSLKVKFVPNNWQASLSVEKLKLDKLLTQLNLFLNPSFNFILAGNATLAIELTGNPDLKSVSVNGQATDLSFFTDVEQTQGGEELNLKIALKAQKTTIPSKSQEFSIQGQLIVNKGSVCIDVVCVEFAEQPLTTIINLLWHPQRLQVNHFDYTHTNIVTIRGSGQFNLAKKWDINTLSIQLIPYSLQQFYTNYLQNFLDEESQFNELNIGGNIQTSLKFNKDNYHIFAKLDNVSVEDQHKNFGLQGLRGKIQWHNKAKNLPSHLHWIGGYITSKQITLGASQLRANLSGKQIRLLAPWYQPVLNGAIHIQQFYLKNIGKENVVGQMSGKLHPISLQTLSTALNILPLSGQISGEIPLVNYRKICTDFNYKDCVKIGGKLQMRIFNGDVIAHSLSLSNILTEKPILKADIDVTKLNLAALTKEIEFGKITGQLSGYIRKLLLVNWEPISFDAHFATPADDHLPHKISQKAVKNLSNLGGGAAVNALSYSVLNFFEEFYYQRMGLGCYLANGVCEMQGVGKIRDGYYIIKGNWLPRIDMIGYSDNKTVDWHELMERIKTVINTANLITNTNSPIVE